MYVFYGTAASLMYSDLFTPILSTYSSSFYYPVVVGDFLDLDGASSSFS
jgi:hypothetical protein